VAQKELARIRFDKASPKNNFKLVSGTGEVVCEEPLIDELFGLRIQNALRIQRTVEVIQYEPKVKEPALQSLPCDRNEDLEEDKEIDPDLAARANYELRWREIREADLIGKGGNRKLDFGSHVTHAEEASLGQHVLSQSQIAKVGMPLTVELTDDLVDLIVTNIRTSPEFKQFHDFERSGKYLICRKNPHSNANADFLFDTQGMDQQSRMVYFRNQFAPGDVRIKFEFVQQPYVTVLAQQVQTSDEVFRLRPWNPFSSQHEVAVDDEDQVFDRKANE
jgi:hypothetical protein